MIFGLLGRLLHSYPDRAWFQSLVDEDLFAEAPFAGEQPDVAAGLALMQGWSRDSAGGMTDEGFDELRADYTRLFIGPEKVLTPPWESVHLSVDRLLFQEQTLQVREWYRRYGLESVHLYNEPDDHIGLELAFLAHLATLGAESASRQDHASLDRELDAQRAFLSEHLLKWALDWCESVTALSQTDFYRGIALMVRGALLEAVRLLDVALPGSAEAR